MHHEYGAPTHKNAASRWLRHVHLHFVLRGEITTCEECTTRDSKNHDRYTIPAAARLECPDGKEKLASRIRSGSNAAHSRVSMLNPQRL
jgi:hypothetical protein